MLGNKLTFYYSEEKAIVDFSAKGTFLSSV